MAQRRNTAPSLKCSVPLPESDNPGVLLEEAAPNLHESVVSPPLSVQISCTSDRGDPSAARREPQGAYSVSYCAFYSRRPFCEPTLPIAVSCSRVPEEQVRHLLLAFSPSLPLFSLVNSTSPPPLSLSLARAVPLQPSTAHQWPTVRSGSWIRDVDQGAGVMGEQPEQN